MVYKTIFRCYIPEPNLSMFHPLHYTHITQHSSVRPESFLVIDVLEKVQCGIAFVKP